MRHIGVLSLTRFGDLIQSIPLLKRIRSQNPESKITLVVMEEFLDAARLMSEVDEVMGIQLAALIHELDLAQGNLSKAHGHLKAILSQGSLSEFDLLINLSHTPRSATFASLMSANQRLGIYRDANGLLRADNPWQIYLFSVMRDRHLNPFNLVEIYGRLYDGERTTNPMTLLMGQNDMAVADGLLSDRRIAIPFVVLHPGTSHISRCWLAARFVELANRLADLGFQIVLTGSADEKQLTDSIVKESHVSVSIAGETSVNTLAAVLSRATCVVSGDTGTIHLASAVGTRTVGIYLGPASVKDTGPYGNNHVLIEADLNCAPCAYNESCSVPSCQNNVEVNHVLPFVLNENAVLSDGESAGVRIYRSSLSENGEYNLDLLNYPRTGPQSGLLAAYRRFWTLFLSGEETEAAERNYFAPTDEWLEGLRELSKVCGDAEFAIQLRNSDRTGLLKWQTDLGTFAVNHRSFAPFAQYIQTQLAFARTVIPNLYFQDLVETTAIFRHGVSLLKLCTHQISRQSLLRDVTA